MGFNMLFSDVFIDLHKFLTFEAYIVSETLPGYYAQMLILVNLMLVNFFAFLVITFYQ